jgi:type I restriction enzyme S subunit
VNGAPGQWATVQLGELVEVLDHKRVPVSAKERQGRQGEIPYYGAAGQVGWIDQALFDEPLVLLGEDGIQFFERNRPKAYLIDGPSWVNNHAHVLRVRPDWVDRRFLLHALNFTDYHGYANGTTRLKLTKSSMCSILVPVPPLDEQRRIVEILEDHLSRLDMATLTLRASLRRLDVLRRLVVMDIAVGAAATLKSLAVDSGYGTSVKCEVGGAGAAVVRIPNLLNGRIDLSDEKRAADPSVDLSSATLAVGDVLIVRTNGSKDLIGRSGVVQEGVDAAFASYLIRYRVDTEKIRPAWLHTMLGAPALRTEIERLAASSAGQHNLSLGKLDGLLIPTPTIAEQDAALARLAEFDDHGEVVRHALDGAVRRSEALRQSLLSAAFRGEITARPLSAA